MSTSRKKRKKTAKPVVRKRRTSTRTLTAGAATPPVDTFIRLQNYTIILNSPMSISASLLRVANSSGVSGKKLTFTVLRDQNSRRTEPLGIVTTSSGGTATTRFTFGEEIGAGKHGIRVSFAGDSQFRKSEKTATITVYKGPTKLSLPRVQGRNGSTVSLVATLVRKIDSRPLSRRSIAFYVFDRNYRLVGRSNTDLSGRVSISYRINHTTSRSMKAVFDGDDLYAASTGNSEIRPVS